MPKKSRKGIKIGQAPALSRRTWAEWIKFIGRECGARIAVILSEALTLKRKDISLNGEIPKIIISGETAGGRKSPGEVYVRKKHIAWLRSLIKSGYMVTRRRRHKHGKGKNKTIDIEDTYYMPEDGFLFVSRDKAKRDHLHYNAVYAHIRKQAPRFLEHLKKQG
ncbi:unnamed protein product, partial [Symbiodinium necroappetens]